MKGLFTSAITRENKQRVFTDTPFDKGGVLQSCISTASASSQCPTKQRQSETKHSNKPGGKQEVVSPGAQDGPNPLRTRAAAAATLVLQSPSPPHHRAPSPGPEVTAPRIHPPVPTRLCLGPRTRGVGTPRVSRNHRPLPRASRCPRYLRGGRCSPRPAEFPPRLPVLSAYPAGLNRS